MAEDDPASKMPSKEPRLVGHVLGELSGLVTAGALLGFFYGIVQAQNRWPVAFYGAVIALASAAVGGLLGLLFGVPRALAGSPNPINTQPAMAATAASTSASSLSPTTASAAGYAGNTNLEQVSDWLTKLLLGAGLTQLVRVPSGLKSLGSYLGPGLGGGSGASSFAVVLVIYSLLIGFFLGFLAARLKLGAAFKEADNLAQSTQVAYAKINLLPEAPVGPTMLRVDQNATPEAKDAARRLFEQVQAIEMKTPGSVFAADDYRRIAQELVAVGLYNEALQILDVAAKEHPNDPSLPLFTGTIYGKYLGKYDFAERNYFKALGINPAYAPAFYNLACNAVRQGNIPSARDYLTKAFAIDPTLRDRSKGDPVWDGVRASGELGDLLPPVS